MELFDDNDLVFPVSMGRENLKILVSPGSESSGVSSLDAEEAKVKISWIQTFMILNWIQISIEMISF